MDKKIQAKHVPEDAIIRAIRRAPRWMTHWEGDDPVWNLPANEGLEGFPQKVLLAKLSSMRRRGILYGCDCGCRGDWFPGPKFPEEDPLDRRVQGGAVGRSLGGSSVARPASSSSR